MTDKEAYYELEKMKTWSADLSDDEIEALAFALRAIGENEKLIESLQKAKKTNAELIARAEETKGTFFRILDEKHRAEKEVVRLTEENKRLTEIIHKQLEVIRRGE